MNHPALQSLCSKQTMACGCILVKLILSVTVARQQICIDCDASTIANTCLLSNLPATATTCAVWFSDPFLSNASTRRHLTVASTKSDISGQVYRRDRTQAASITCQPSRHRPSCRTFPIPKHTTAGKALIFLSRVSAHEGGSGQPQRCC